MADADAEPLPDVAQVLGPLLARVARERQPLLVAIAERLAAERYRRWAGEPDGAAYRDAFRACAEREEEIASRIEALYPDAAAQQRAIRDANPDLATINRDLFAGRPLRDQLAIQARGERVGAATWRAFAREADLAARAPLEACARLEEENAAALEAILGRER